MKTEYLKTLWMLRFEKVRKNEEEAAWKYQEILDQCLVHFSGEKEILEYLRELVSEERVHAKMAEELIRICHQNHPECRALLPEEQR